jgi:hypothetical protein
MYQETRVLELFDTRPGFAACHRATAIPEPAPSVAG